MGECGGWKARGGPRGEDTLADERASLDGKSAKENTRGIAFAVAACALLVLMTVLAGGAALRESVTIDEVSHIGAGVSYVQRLDLRLNEEHPPLPKVLAALPLVVRGVRTDYSHVSWAVSDTFFLAYLGQWVFGEWLMTRWNDARAVLNWARAPMLLLTLVLGWVVFAYGRRLGGRWGGLLSLSVFVTAPTFLAFGPLVHTDMAVTLFSLVTLWRFAEVWKEPSRNNAALLGLSLAGALLSKFTAGILLFVFLGFAWSTRWRSVPGQPSDKAEVRAWRRLRWRATLRGLLWAALAVYVFYFVFSVHQTTDALNRVGHGAAAVPLRRLLMPAWLYLRGVLLVLITGSRPTFLLGHSYPHGVWFYFPVLLVLKSAPGFLGLLALAAGLGLWRKRSVDGQAAAAVIPEEYGIHWRVLWVSLVVFTAFCMLSRLDISIRHFTVPLALLILLLSAVPRLIQRLQTTAPLAGRVALATAALLTASCFFTALHAYPYYVPYVSVFGFGHPAYVLANDSNVDWNQSLPEVRKFAEQHRLRTIAVDQWGFNEPSAWAPQAEVWNCQKPGPADDGQWVIVSGNMILDGHNCGWLLQYPHQALAGGSIWAVHLPEHVPAAGSAGGPPAASAFRQFAGAPFDIREYFLELNRYPERLPRSIEEMQAKFKSSTEAQAAPPAPSAK